MTDWHFEDLEDDVIWPSDKTIEEVNAKVKECLDRLGSDIPFPEITYDLEGRTAAYAIGSHKIRLNLVLLKENREDMINNTVPHEVAHLVVSHKYPNAKAHGYEWQRTMHQLGLLATRCHQYETTVARVHKKYEHRCNCPEPHLVGAKIHRNIEFGIRNYYCRRCKQQLRKEGEV